MIRERKYYLDILRICSVCAVVLMHSAGFFQDEVDPGSVLWLSAVLYSSITRFAVPVFVMISGALMLGRDTICVKRLFSKSILRLVAAYLFWAFIYTLVFSFFGYYEGKITTLSVKNLISGVLRGGYFHLWYMPMIIGLYVLSPVLKAFLSGADRDTMKYWLTAGFVICFCIPVVMNVGIIGEMFGESVELFSNNAWGVYVFYFILGYLLDQLDDVPLRPGILCVLGVAGGLISVLGTAALSVHTGVFQRTLIDNNALPILAISVALFVIVKRRCDRNWIPKHPQIITRLSQYAFGVYLVHELVLVAIHPYIVDRVPEICSIPVLFLVGMLISYLFVWGIDRVKPVAKYII